MRSTAYIEEVERRPFEVERFYAWLREDIAKSQICHLLDGYGEALCGAGDDVVGVDVQGLRDPYASPCAAGCGRPRCEGCAVVCSLDHLAS